MPAPHRDVAERRRNERKAKSPYNPAGRQNKMKANRGWGSSIWGALSWVTGRKPSNEEEESEDEEETRETNMSMEDTQNDSDASAMNLSTMSEDQVLTQLTMRDSRQVRFDFASSLGRVQSNEAGPSTPVRPPPIPYVAPVPPSVAQKQASPPFENPIEKVTEYLQTTVIPRGGQCTDVEALGLSLLLQSAVSKPSPSSSNSSQYQGSPDRVGRDALAFVGLTTPSPLKPTFTKPDTDIASVLMASTSSDGSPNRPSPGRPSAARTLAHNPNGQLVFSGGGSARPRYRSPSFGSPSPSRNRNGFPRNFGAQKQAEPPASPSDGKRRRVGEEKDTSVAQPSGLPVADSQDSQANGIKVNGTVNGTTSVATTGPSRSTTTTSTSNLPRFGVLRYSATTPARPSPLRQSVRADSSSPGSPSENANGVNGPASTRAGQIMASIISNASPTRPERSAETESIEAIQNPYAAGRNTRKRTKLPTKPKQSPRPQLAKTASPAPPVPKKPTAAELIEMTAPTGSKRSHESVKTNGATKPSPFRPTVVEIVDDDDEPKAKKQKAEDKGKEKAKAPTQEVINLDDDDIVMTSGSGEPVRPSEIIEPGDTPKEERKESEVHKPPFGTVPAPKAGKFPSAPKEPSPLRQSFQPEEAAKPAPAPAPASLFGFGNITTTTSNPGGTTTQSTTTTAFDPSGNTSIFGSSTTTTGSRPTFGSSSTPSLFGSASATIPPSTISPFGTAAAGGSPFGAAPAAAFADASKKEENAAKPAASFFDGLKTTTAPVPKVEEKEKPAESSRHPLFGRASATTSTSLFGASAPAATPKSEDDLAAAKKEALSAPSSTLPKYDFKIPSSSGTSFLAEYPEARRAALAIPASELPKYNFDIPKASTSTFASTSTPITASANTSTPQPAIDTAQKKGFDWSAAGMKKPEVTGWKCTVCDVPNKDSAEKCVACETPKPGSEPKPMATAGFNWSAAGMKKPEVTGWKCSVCDVSNKDTAEKCIACETPKPGSEVKPKAPFGFNWSAAGMKKPETTGWKCDVCMVQNKDSDVKCVSCTADKPGGAPVEDKAKSPPTAASGFNWAAAGMKPPQAEPGWKCDMCLVKNKDDAVKCVACESDKPGSKTVAASSAPAVASFGGFGGFSGFKPAATSSESKPVAGGFTPSGGFAPGGGFTFGGSKPTTTSTSTTGTPSKGSFTPSFGSGLSSTSAPSLFGSGLSSASSNGGFTPSLFGTGPKPVGFTPLFGTPKPAEEKVEDKEEKKD